MSVYYTISEFAELISVSIPTLRLWEKRGVLTPHHRTPGGQRRYVLEQVEQYLNICKSK